MVARRARVQADPTGAAAEQVLVLEIAGSVADFVRAVQRIEGAEWLGEIDDVFEPDEDFYLDEEHLDHDIRGQLFLVMSDQQALDEILSLWQRWLADPTQRLRHGLAPWKHVFAHLRDIRLWDARDRVSGTGILEDWRERVARGQDVVPAEIELWYRSTAEARRAAEGRVRHLVERSDGRILSRAAVDEISYHALLAEIPAALVSSIVEAGDARLVRADDIMFFRPTGQALVPIPAEEPLPASALERPEQLVAGDPVVALLDGLPLENHDLLAGRLIVDDPDGWAAAYEATSRVHGTAMASLICNGDVSTVETPSNRPLYARPIMRPGPAMFDGSRAERVPEDVLFVDLLHRSVRRMYEGEAGEGPAAPSVRIINLAVCDPSVPLGRYPSPLARIVDWLSWRYETLFVISAGNYPTNVSFSYSAAALDVLPARELEALTLAALINNAAQRRLLAPGEAVNALTVGAAHEDAYTDALPTTQRNLIESPRLPSPVNAAGLGFRRMVKPDLLVAGGRQLYRDASVSGGTCSCSPAIANAPPGQRAAAPGTVAGELSATRYSRGTSNAAARASRHLAWLHDAVVIPMREQLGDLPDSLLLKALLVHTASWDNAIDRLEPVLEADHDWRHLKDHCARLIGYGAVDESRLGGSSPSRVVLVGASSLAEDLAHVYSIPLPPSLSGQAIWRRVTMTLAWATPINPRHRSYRRAQLWFDAPKESLAVERVNAQWQAVRRGTVQHEVLEGERAAAFADGDTLDIRVNCKADAGELADEVPYALVVTLEAAPLLGVPIYEEVEARITPRVAVTVAAQ